MQKVIALFADPMHAEVCISNLEEADFKPQSKKVDQQTEIVVTVPFSQVPAVQEIIQDHQPQELKVVET